MQADHVSGLPELVERTGATAYLPAGAGVEFDHHPLADGEVVELGNTEIEAIATPGHAPPTTPTWSPTTARGDEPWIVLTGDALLVGDAGRPDLHAHGEHSVEEMARTLYRSLTERLLTLPDHLAALPGALLRLGLRARAVGQPDLDDRLRAPPQPALQFDSEDAFVAALTQDIPPAPEQQAAIVAANRSGRPLVGDARDRAARSELGLRENLRAVLAAGRGQRVRRRDGRPRALDAAADRRARTSASPPAPRCSRSSSPSGSPRRSPTSAPARSRERVGRRRLLIAGWAVALPVPLLIAVAPSWGWIVAANVLLGVNQGLAWSMTVVMKIDLVGPKRRGLALGLNEAAGYGGVALAAGLSGWLAAEFAARDVLVVAGAVIAVVAFLISRAVRARHRRARRARAGAAIPTPTATRRRLREAFARRHLPRARRCAPARRPAWSTTSTTRSPGAWCRCSSPPTAPASPRSGSSPRVYPGVWSVGADRHRPLVRQRRAQAADRRRHAPSGRRARAARAQRRRVALAAGAAVLLGLGTALVYPTLIAAISDAVSPVARAPVVGVYRFWRDMGYALGALIAGAVADALGYGGAIAVVAALTAASGLWVLRDMPSARPSQRRDCGFRAAGVR